MKRLHWMLLSAAATTLVAFQANAAVQVTPSPEPEPQKEAPPAAPQKVEGSVEKPVALKADGGYVTANPGGVIDVLDGKIGSKQSFTLIDLNGGELADGDEVKIQYIPGKGGGAAGDLTKSTFWTETPEGVKRSRQGVSFKIKQVGTKYAFQTLKGKFVGKPAAGALALIDKQEDALLVEFVDLSHGIPKAPKRPKAPKSEAKDTAAPPPADKPSAE